MSFAAALAAERDSRPTTVTQCDNSDDSESKPAESKPAVDPARYVSAGGKWGIRIINHAKDDRNWELAWMTGSGMPSTEGAEKSCMEAYSVAPPARFESPKDAADFLIELFEGEAACSRGQKTLLDKIGAMHYCKRSTIVSYINGLDSDLWNWVPMKSYKITMIV